MAPVQFLFLLQGRADYLKTCGIQITTPSSKDMTLAPLDIQFGLFQATTEISLSGMDNLACKFVNTVALLSAKWVWDYSNRRHRPKRSPAHSHSLAHLTAQQSISPPAHPPAHLALCTHKVSASTPGDLASLKNMVALTTLRLDGCSLVTGITVPGVVLTD